MKLEEIDFDNVDAEELKKSILQEAGIDDFFLNQPLGYPHLASMYQQSLNGKTITSLEEAQKMVATIKQDWSIDSNHVMAQVPLLSNDTNSDFYANQVEAYRATELNKVGENRLGVNTTFCQLQSNFSQEASRLPYEDMPSILENGNRVHEVLWHSLYENNKMVEKSTQSKVSTMNPTAFAQLQNSFRTNSLSNLQEILAKPDLYWENSTSKDTAREFLSATPYQKMASPQMERTSYSNDKMNNLAQSVMQQNHAVSSREQIMAQALSELGVAPEFLQDSRVKGYLMNMVEETLSNHSEIGDLTTQDSIQNLLKYLNQDLMIKDHYVARKIC